MVYFQPTSNRKVLGSTPDRSTRNFFLSMPVSLSRIIHHSHHHFTLPTCNNNTSAIHTHYKAFSIFTQPFTSSNINVLRACERSFHIILKILLASCSWKICSLPFRNNNISQADADKDMRRTSFGEGIVCHLLKQITVNSKY